MTMTMTMASRVGRAFAHAHCWPLRTAVLGLVLAVAFTQLGDACGAQASAEMLAIGQDMLRVPEPPDGLVGDRVLLNGAELQVARGRTQQAVAEFLAGAEKACNGEPLRGGDARHGFVACADEGAEGLTVPVAYVYAERRGEATHFIGIQSAQPIDIGALFPREADAPGQDPEALPRPHSSRRALSFRVADQPYQAVVYLDGERGLDDLVAHYRAALPRAGWTTVADWRVEEGRGPRQVSVAVEREGVTALLVVAQDRAQATTTFLTMEANREQ